MICTSCMHADLHIHLQEFCLVDMLTSMFGAFPENVGFQVLLVANGMLQPRLTSILGMIWLIPRFMYGYGYAKHGPKGRLLGVYLSLLGIYPLIALLFFNGVRLLGWLA